MDVAKICIIHNSSVFVMAPNLCLMGMLLIFGLPLYSAEPCDEYGAVELRLEQDENFLELEQKLDAILAENERQRALEREELEFQRYELEHFVKIKERKVLGENELRERAILKKAVHQSIKEFDKKCFARKIFAHLVKQLTDEQFIHILVHNANVPIQSMKVFEKDSTAQEAAPRSPNKKPVDRALWDISVRRAGSPYLLTLVAHGMLYQALIPSVDKGFGDELMLIQKKTPNGFVLQLGQTEEGDEYEVTKTINLVNVPFY